MVKYKLNKYFKNGSYILTKYVKTKGPASYVNFDFGHNVGNVDRDRGSKFGGMKIISPGDKK